MFHIVNVSFLETLIKSTIKHLLTGSCRRWWRPGSACW